MTRPENATALVDEANNKTRCDVTVEFYSQQYSMGITLFVVALGAAFFFVTAIFVVRDKAACENCSSKSPFSLSSQKNYSLILGVLQATTLQSIMNAKLSKQRF